MTSQAYLSELFSLDGRVAVVMGGSSGIGRAIGAAAELRFKETDRLATTTDMLAGFGVPAKSDAASITVRGSQCVAAGPSSRPTLTGTATTGSRWPQPCWPRPRLDRPWCDRVAAIAPLIRNSSTCWSN